MIRFNCDYSEGAHPRILQKLIDTNLQQTAGYGEDPYCEEARGVIRGLCDAPDAAVHFLVGGTQANLTVIASILRPHQGVLCAEPAHINQHETGAIEACGHKVLPLPSGDGKLSAAQVRAAYHAHWNDPTHEHRVQPKLVYISNTTELGTVYTRAELGALHEACRELGLYLYLDGARLCYALCAQENDLDLPALARLCDVFYIGGTKAGLLFGEAVVIPNPALQEDFRCIIKQKGGMLAKGRLLGLQFGELLRDGLYFELGAHADRLACRIRDALREKGFELAAQSGSNQQFALLPPAAVEALGRRFVCEVQAAGDGKSLVRFCTSWATAEADAEALCAAIRGL